MDITNLKSCVSHEEAMIRSFMRDPEFAEYYLQAVLADGDEEEIREVQAWREEALSPARSMEYWDGLVLNAEKTAKSGQNIVAVIKRVSEALSILKAAVPAVSAGA